MSIAIARIARPVLLARQPELHAAPVIASATTSVQSFAQATVTGPSEKFEPLYGVVMPLRVAVKDQQRDVDDQQREPERQQERREHRRPHDVVDDEALDAVAEARTAATNAIGMLTNGSTCQVVNST